MSALSMDAILALIKQRENERVAPLEKALADLKLVLDAVTSKLSDKDEEIENLRKEVTELKATAKSAPPAEKPKPKPGPKASGPKPKASAKQEGDTEAPVGTEPTAFGNGAPPKKVLRPKSAGVKKPVGSDTEVQGASSADAPLEATGSKSTSSSQRPSTAPPQRPKSAKPAPSKKEPAAAKTPLPKASSRGELQAGGVPFVLQARKFTVYPPTNWVKPANLDDLPAKSLALEHIYGYRGNGKEFLDNLRYLESGKVAFYTAAALVTMDPASRVQEFMIGHTDDITSLAVHPNGKFVATGQLDPKGKENKAFFNVWDVTTKQAIATCHGAEVGICALAFSKDGSTVCAVSSDGEHTVTLWDWAKSTVIGSSRGGPDRILAVAFSPIDDTVVTCGVKYMAFWTLDPATKQLNKKKGIFGKKGELQTLLTVAFSEDGSVLTGTQLAGAVYVWKTDGELVQALPAAHKGAVYIIRPVPGGLFTAGKDGKIIHWTKAADAPWTECKASATLETGLDIKTFDLISTAEGYKFLVGTATNRVLEIIVTKELEKKDEKILTEGHTGEMWGLAVAPAGPLFLTSSDDKTVRLWNATEHRQLSKLELSDGLKTAAFAADGSVAAVASKAGEVFLLAVPGLTVLSKTKQRSKEVADIKFSPDASLLAVGTHEMAIDILDVKKDLKRIHILKGHTAGLKHLDWSEDGKFLQSTSADYELLFWDVSAGKQVTETASMRDVKWATFTVPLGWPVSGVWPTDSDGTDVNAVCRSTAGDIIAIGDDHGLVRISRFPSIAPGKNEPAKSRDSLGHSAHVTNVRFFPDDSTLISTGGNDCSVFQWKVVAP